MSLPTIGQFAADVAHQLNNPVGGVIGLTQLLLDGKGLGPQERKDVETILGQGQRCRAVIQDLLLFGPAQNPKKEAMDLSPLIHSILEKVHYDFLNFGLKVVNECPPSLPSVMGDSGQLQQVLLHLFMKTRRAVAGQKEKKLYIHGGKTGAGVCLRLRHTGRVIPEDTLQTDLGWSACREILQKHSGTLSTQSEESSGVTFIMELPVYA